MAVNYHQPSVVALFDAMPVPLLTFGVSGRVTYANPAAKLHPGKLVESLDSRSDVKILVADAVLGKNKLPHTVEFELAGGHRTKGKFMAGPAGLDIAFMALDGSGNSLESGAQSGQIGLRETIALLRSEIGPPMKNLIVEIRGQPVNESTKALEGAAKILHERLSRLTDLIDIFGEEVAFDNDRVEVAPLIELLCQALAPRARAMQVNFRIVASKQTLPPIYGSEKLIRRAFQECLENALVHSRKAVTGNEASTVEIRLRMTGTHVMMGIHNQGATVVKVRSSEVLKPFAATSASGPVRLGLPLIQRIVEMHGGSMRMNNAGDDNVNVLLEFPTGAPQRVQNQLDAAQAQRYASDLAQLMSSRKRRKNDS